MRKLTLIVALLASAHVFACAPAAARPGETPATKPATIAGKKSAGVTDRLKAGQEAFAASKYKDAEAHFRAAANGAKRGEALIGLGETQLITGRYDEAIATARQAQAVKAAKPDAGWLEGE